MAHFFVVAEAHIKNKKGPLREQWSLGDSFAIFLGECLDAFL